MTTFVNCDGHDIFESECDALVNPVNCHGVMGAGLAKAFKERYPIMFEKYRDGCKRRKLSPGRIFYWKEYDQTGEAMSPWILNLATKDHWKQPSQIEWIEEGVCRIKKLVYDLNLRSIAIPKLGCGHGGLDWSKVKPVIEWHLQDDVNRFVVELY